MQVGVARVHTSLVITIQFVSAPTPLQKNNPVKRPRKLPKTLLRPLQKFLRR